MRAARAALPRRGALPRGIDKAGSVVMHHGLLLDDAAGQPAARVARRLRLAVVLALVEDDGLADHRVGSRERQGGGRHVEMALAVGADRDVAEVAGVARARG